jgi:hypothetical protein
MIRPTATGMETTIDAAVAEPSKRRKQATKPIKVAAALGDGGGGGAASGGRLGGAGSMDSNAMRVTSRTSILGCNPE